jgi:hypothetical protein
MAEQNANAVAITGGTINGTTIGATTPATGVFTTLTAQTEVLKGTGQNLVVRSQALATSPWTAVSGATVSNDTTDVTDPLGGSTASKIVSSGAFPAVFQSNTLQGIVYTASIYLRTLSGTVSARIVTSLSGSPFTAIGSSSITITSTWQRFSYTTSAPPTSTTYNFQIDQFGTNTFYAWGAQLEVGTSVNTYIPTTTTAVYGTPTLSFSGVSTIGLESNGSLFVQPAGTGALQAQATTSTTTGGNVRGSYATDWQKSRVAATQVASGSYSFIGGGDSNTSAAFGSVVVGGSTNSTTGGAYNAILGGVSNATGSNGQVITMGGGHANSAQGFFNIVGGGYANSGTSGPAVTTQSATMNGTTAVTLSGSNASIKVGQLITGTSIGTYPHTYVAAISGTSLTLSQAASGSSTSILSFFTPHGVVVGGGNNQATGSYSFIGGGGDAGTAGNRNVASGDWSVVGGGRNNQATGSASFIGGGGTVAAGAAGNLASGDLSFIGGGRQNNATGTESCIISGVANIASGNVSTVLGGRLATTRGIIGNVVGSASESPIASSAGSSQFAFLVLGKQTTDATASVLTSNGGSGSTNNQVILPNNSAYYFKGSVIANVTGAANGASWSFEGAIMRGANAASTVLMGTPAINRVAATAGATAWVIALTADTTNGGLAVTVTGAASTTIRFVAKIETTEVTF